MQPSISGNNRTWRYTTLYFQAIIERGDIRRDGRLDYQEFMLFMLEHERDLWEHFVELDHDGSGQFY